MAAAIVAVHGAACLVLGLSGHGFLDPPNAVIILPRQLAWLGAAQLALVMVATVARRSRARRAERML